MLEEKALVAEENKVALLHQKLNLDKWSPSGSSSSLKNQIEARYEKATRLAEATNDAFIAVKDQCFELEKLAFCRKPVDVVTEDASTSTTSLMQQSSTAETIFDDDDSLDDDSADE